MDSEGEIRNYEHYLCCMYLKFFHIVSLIDLENTSPGTLYFHGLT